MLRTIEELERRMHEIIGKGHNHHELPNKAGQKRKTSDGDAGNTLCGKMNAKNKNKQFSRFEGYMKTLLLLLILFTATTFGQNKTTQTDTVYKDQKYFFRISYPANWKDEAEKSHPLVRLEVISNETANFTITVINVKGSEKVTSANYVKLFLEENPNALKQMATQILPDAKIISTGKTFLSNKEAFYLIFEGSFKTLNETILMKIYTLQVLFEGNIYTISFGSEKVEFDKYLPTFKAIASSFGIIPTKVTVTPKKKSTIKKNK